MPPALAPVLPPSSPHAGAPILLVEDDPRDLQLTLDALARCGLGNPIEIARDGASALDCLNRIGRWLDRPSCEPAAVILDVDLPGIDGIEVLDRVKSNPRLCHIPIVMLTASQEERDLVRSYRLGVDAFVVKPIDFSGCLRAIADIGLVGAARREPLARVAA